MRILKKFIRKLYHLIWFLSVFILFSNKVNASTINVTYPSLVTSASNLTSGIQCNSSYCVNYTVPVRFDMDFTTLWTANSSKTCSSQASVSGHINVQGSGELTINPDWLHDNLLRVYLSTNNFDYSCNYSNPTGGHIYYTCLVSNLASNFSIGYVFRKRTTSTSYTDTTSIAYRDIDISCSSSGSGDSQEIIDNNTFNTDRVINSQNNNTDRIINDNRRENKEIKDKLDENNEKQIESQKVCKNIDNSYIKTTGFLDSSGSILSDYPSYGVTSYINVSSGSLKVNSNYNGGRLAFYTANKTFISAINNSSLSPNTYITIPSNAKYVRFTINKSSNAPTFTLCTSGNQALNDSVNDLNDSLTDSSVDSSDSSLSELQNGLPTNSVISDLLLLPVRLLQAIVNSLGGTCSSFNLGSLYGTNLVMPCINLESYLGSTIWVFIDLVFSGIFILVIRKKFIQIFQNITNLRSGGNEVD